MTQIYVFSTAGGVAIQIGYSILAAKIKESGKYDYQVVEWSDKKCSILFYDKRTSKPLGPPSEYTWEEATRAGLTGKNNWKNSPKNMLFARAMSTGQRAYCPDVLNDAQGLTVYTEADDINVIEGEVVPNYVTRETPSEPEKEPSQALRDAGKGTRQRVPRDVTPPTETAPPAEAPKETLANTDEPITVKTRSEIQAMFMRMGWVKDIDGKAVFSQDLYDWMNEFGVEKIADATEATGQLMLANITRTVAQLDALTAQG